MYTIDLYEVRVQSTDTCAEERSASHGRPRVALYDFPSQSCYLYDGNAHYYPICEVHVCDVQHHGSSNRTRAPSKCVRLAKGRPIPPYVRFRGLHTDKARQDEARRV